MENRTFLESINEQRRQLTNVLIVVVVVLDAIWALVYGYLHFYPNAAGEFGIFFFATFLPKTIYAIIGGILSYCVIVFILNKKGRLPWPKAQAAILISLLTLLVTLSDDHSQVVAGSTSFILLAPVFLAAELIHPAAGIFVAIIEFLAIDLISLQTKGLTINSFSVTVIWFLAVLAWANAQKKINSTMIAYAEGEKNLAVLESMADGILVYDEQGQCIQANDSADRILEGREGRSNLLAQALLQGGESITLQWTQTKTIGVTLSPLQNEKGEHQGTVACIRDITRETIVSSMKNSILSIVAHELRTPTSAIKGYVDLMLMAPDDPEVQDQARTAILDNTKRLLLLIGDLVDNASLEAGTLSLHITDVNIRGLVNEITSLQKEAASTRNLELKVNVSTNVPETTRTDRGRLMQICQNLLNNAMKFTEVGKVEFNVHVAQNNLLITVEDTGVGIPGENIEFIFQPLRRLPDFATRNTQGAGLGLSIAKKLTELLDGEISVTSRVGVGSIFAIKLPLEEK